MEISIKVSGSMVKPMETDVLHRYKRGLCMMENGIWTLCMAKENLPGIMGNALMKVISKKELELDKEFTKKESKHTLDKFKMANSMDKELMNSTTLNHTKKKTK
jgi:hypothetical protein